ncbi:histidine phosphatase family protein [Geitlerinema splendidum]|nr:histidine phosphatase family protein [Geitlerinema splendidum]
MTTRVILVRHGQSSYNLERRIQGRCDKSVLTEKGRQDAKIVGQLLRNFNLSAIYASPLQRAKATAETIIACLDNPPPLKTPDNLKEIDLPLWEEFAKTDVKAKFPDDYRCWKDRPHEFCMNLAKPEGSQEHFPVLSLFEQAKSFWQEILPQHDGETILVVAHNGINRCLLATAIGISPEDYHGIQQSNCGISILNFAGGLADPVQLESMNLTSHMGEPFPLPREEHRGCRLLLVRHGETDWNRDKRFQGWCDVPLNETGRQQAQKAAEFLKGVKIDFAISSSMLRPKETAEIILQHHPELELQLEDGLREISHGLWEGKLEAEIEAAYPGLLHQWQIAPETVQMPEGENLQQVWERAIAAWDKIVQSAAPGSVGLVVAHDAINKAILCHLFNLEPQHFWKFKQGNGSVTVIDYPKGAAGKPVLEAHNITTHLSGGDILDKTAAGAL